MFFYNLRKFCVPKKSSKKMARMTQHSQKKWCKKKMLRKKMALIKNLQKFQYVSTCIAVINPIMYCFA